MFRRSQLKLYSLFGCAFILLFGTYGVFAATVTVEPETTRSIKGISVLDRLKYFNLASNGSWYESKLDKCVLDDRYNYYTYDLEMTFGRELCVIKWEVQYGNSIYEDPANTIAAADLAVNLLQYGYTDFTRPVFVPGANYLY